MNRQEIEQKVAETISNIIGMDQHDIEQHHSLQDDLGADSLDELEIVMELERTFAVKIPDDTWAYGGVKVSDICDAVEQLTTNKAL